MQPAAAETNLCVTGGTRCCGSRRMKLRERERSVSQAVNEICMVLCYQQDASCPLLKGLRSAALTATVAGHRE